MVGTDEHEAVRISFAALQRDWAEQLIVDLDIGNVVLREFLLNLTFLFISP